MISFLEIVEEVAAPEEVEEEEPVVEETPFDEEVPEEETPEIENEKVNKHSHVDKGLLRNLVDLVLILI